MRTKHYAGVVVGCGKIGALMERDLNRVKPATHAGALTMNKKTTLAALVDTDKSNLAMAGKLFTKARRYTNLGSCLKKEKPDIAIVATGPVGRIGIIRACLKAQIPMIICEKPIANSIKEALAIQKLLQKSSSIFVVNYQRRFFHVFQKLRKDIQAGKLGTIQQVTCYYTNGLYNNGGHVIDAIHYLLGQRTTSVSARRNRRNKTVVKNDTNIDALMVTNKGTVVTLQSMDKSKWGILDISLYADKGCVVLGDYGCSYTFIPAGKSFIGGVDKLDMRKKKTFIKKESIVAGALAHTIGCFEKGKKPENGIVNAIEVLAAAEALSRSAITNKWTIVPHLML
ncbi:Gfo/Idh/MocA family oxidoreductase [Candidatus Kaiserbacteria bacterium]|nr:Gfo/Idh/MocA family oxidoreductase [Candidatus Kaiserbacteria bacterium]